MLKQLKSLDGKKGLVVGVANEHSIAAGCAKAFHEAGADLAITYQNEKSVKYISPVLEQVKPSILAPLDVEKDEQLDHLLNQIEQDWGRLDFIVHSIAFCPKEDLHGRVLDCSRDGFAKAMDISVHSLIRIAKKAEQLMSDGGTILTVSYHGAEKVVDHYNIMGPVKAALEATVRYLAVELGPKNVRVNALSPGPLMTRAASGIDHFDQLIDDARSRAALHRLTNIEEIGAYAAFLVSDNASSVSGNTVYIDGGHHIV